MQKRMAYTTNRLMQVRASSTKKHATAQENFSFASPLSSSAFVDFLLFLVKTLRVYCIAGESEDILSQRSSYTKDDMHDSE